VESEIIASIEEELFHEFLPVDLRRKSARFFTPRHIAIQSALWLSGKDHRKILDIGAGVGKFCFYGACHTQSQFFGIEIRPRLVKIAEKLFTDFNVKNAKVVHGNITDFDFSEFSAFYYYNPFQENLVPDLRMDDAVMLSPQFYHVYRSYAYAQLNNAKKGARLVTFYGNNFDIPLSYRIIKQFEGGGLKYWVKK
jgi:predicted RNA methylase